MNMKLKAAVAAAALAFAGQAAAEISNGGTSPAGQGAGELFMIAYDLGSGSSYTFDTGIRFNTFAPGSDTAQDFDISGDSRYNTVLAGVTGTVQWAVGAFSQTGAVNSTSRALLSTASIGESPVGIQQNAGINNLSNNNTFLSAVNATGTHKNTPVNYNLNGSTVNVGGNAYAGSGANAPKNTWNGSTVSSLGTWHTTGAIDDQLAFYSITDTVGGGASAVTTVATYGGTWSLTSSEHLVYTAAAPVPEPGTWAMLIAGLMMVGGIARRRLS